MTFELMAYVTAIAGTALGVRFIFFGASVLEQWGTESSDGAVVMCRRYGALYLGLAVMFWLGRHAPPSELRSAVCLGLGVGTALLAGLGFWEKAARRVSSGIVVPAIIEVLFAAGFGWAWWNGR